jgi:cytidine deaminase
VIKKETFSFNYWIYQDFSELGLMDQKLLEKSKDFLENAYAPYSGLQVGAAVLLSNDQILAGANQENAAFPVTLCAERTVLNFAGSNYPDNHIITIAVTAKQADKKTIQPAIPCGSCRQSLSEFEDRQNHPIRVLLQRENGTVFLFDTIKDLLPFSFSRLDLI